MFCGEALPQDLVGAARKLAIFAADILQNIAARLISSGHNRLRVPDCMNFELGQFGRADFLIRVDLDFGRVIGIGEPDAIMASREVREIYLGMEV